ncbi:glycosyltransferase family 2 protein [Bacteroides sp.]
MKLTVVIVNYNVKYYLEQCLISLYRAIENVPAEVVVVDNASTDGSPEYITERFPHLTYIYNEENVGFARANNQAMQKAKGEYVLLLNPDTLLPETNITEALAFMDAHPDAGACGVKMLAPDGHFLPESKRGYPSPATSFWKLIGMHRFFPDNPRFDGYYLSRLDENSIHSVPVLAGAYMMLRKTALDSSGLLDEDFFMYGEDIDLSCRITEAGYRNYYLPFPILHYKGESTSKESYRYVRVFYGAMDIFFCKHGTHYPLPYQWMIRVGIKLQTWLKLAIVCAKKHIPVFHSDKETKPRFLIFASEKNMHGIRAICQSNHLGDHHHFVVSNERTTLNGHELSFGTQEDFTHVVYDSSVFSYSAILSLLSQNRKKALLLGVYNPQSRVLVTPEKNYV